MNFTLAPDLVIAAVLIFARIGTLVMLVPTLGERSVPVRIRLAVALLLTLAFFPYAKPLLPTANMAETGLLALLLTEIMVGLVIGLAARLIGTILITAGTLIGQYLGLAFAVMVDPNQGSQGTTLSTFLSLLGLVMVFATDLHHLSLVALHDSYQLFKPGVLLNVQDAMQLIVKTVSHTFVLAMQISAPFLVVSLVLNASLGLVAKMMPQMQVFFVAMPLSIGLGFLLMLFFLSAMMGTYLSHYSTAMSQFTVR